MIDPLVFTAEGPSCAEVDPELFFPELGSKPFDAKRVCVSCPLLHPCWDYAIHHSEAGVWGNTTESERARYRTKHGIVPQRAPAVFLSMTDDAQEKRRSRKRAV